MAKLHPAGGIVPRLEYAKMSSVPAKPIFDRHDVVENTHITLLENDLRDVRVMLHHVGKPLELRVGESLQQTVTVTESEVLDSDLDDESDYSSSATTISRRPSLTGVVRHSFEVSQSQWADDPIISQWRNVNHRIHRIMADLEVLHKEWQQKDLEPFSPVTDTIWLHTGQVMADVGLPWHNNQINMPDELDTSWPFHFKQYEVQAIKAKGSRVGDPNPAGYVCNWGEANCYGIRALQQELREKCPDQRPLLVYDQMDLEIVRSAEKLFGLELLRVNLNDGIAAFLADLVTRTQKGARPIIFAATLASMSGRSDDIGSIIRISENLPVILHIDASRNFDYITTMNDSDRQNLGIEKLTLGMRPLDQSLRLEDGSVVAGTIIAGGSNYTSPASVVALKPLALGSLPTKVAYTRASDSTLAGSRDALAPLWVGLHELRFGEDGFRAIYQHCSQIRTALIQALDHIGVPVLVPLYSLDLILTACTEAQSTALARLGGVINDDGTVLLTIQPSIKSQNLRHLIRVFSPSSYRLTDTLSIEEQDFVSTYPVPQDTVNQLEDTVHSWKVATRSAAGYPFHMGSYSGLGPVIGNFLNLKIPDAWTQARAEEILDARLKSFNLLKAHDRAQFKGAFTNGSTMGNRVGIHTALTHFPTAFLYFSSETHYSVPKTARDCDSLTNRWSNRAPRYAEIPSDTNGSMCVESLVQQALTDRRDCLEHGEVYRLILFLNMGTTFVGARDNLGAIRQRLAEVDIEISYVHMDGALDFGFHDCGIALGPPGKTNPDGIPVVQGVTLSHHKAMGNMVSGEVLCYSPGSQLATLGSGVDPRAIFETWLYMQVYSETDLVEMHQHCVANASRLEASLNDIGVVTKRNGDSTIVVLERPPAWVTEEFSLRPEEDWVHFITMSHISVDTVDLFVDRIAWVDRQCEVAFRYVAPLLTATMKTPLRLKRVQCRSLLAGKVRALAQTLVQPTNQYYESIDVAIKAGLRGAMTVVAVDENNEPQAIFLAESFRDRKIRPGPVVARSKTPTSKKMILDVARQLVGFMARHLNVELETDEMSYFFLPLP